MKPKPVYTLSEQVVQKIHGVVFVALDKAVRARTLFHGEERNQQNERIRWLIRADRDLLGYLLAKDRLKMARGFMRKMPKKYRKELARQKRTKGIKESPMFNNQIWK